MLAVCTYNLVHLEWISTWSFALLPAGIKSAVALLDPDAHRARRQKNLSRNWKPTTADDGHLSTPVRDGLLGMCAAQVQCTSCGLYEGSAERFKTCNGCGQAKYCSRRCQKEHWGQHKAICRSFSGEGHVR